MCAVGIHGPVHSRWKLRHRLQPTLKATATNQDSRTKSWLPSKGQRAGNSDPLIQEPVLPLALLNSLSSQFEAASCSSLHHHHPIARSTEGGRKQPVSRTAPQSNTGQIETTQMCGPEDMGGGGEEREEEGTPTHHKFWVRTQQPKPTDLCASESNRVYTNPAWPEQSASDAA